MNSNSFFAYLLINFWSLNFFIVEEQLLELQTVEDLEIIFEKGNFLKEDEDRYVFRKALEIIGRIDLVKKFEIYLAAGKL